MSGGKIKSKFRIGKGRIHDKRGIFQSKGGPSLSVALKNSCRAPGREGKRFLTKSARLYQGGGIA